MRAEEPYISMLLGLSYGLWFLYWRLKARSAKAALRQEPLRKRVLFGIQMIVGIWTIFLPQINWGGPIISGAGRFYLEGLGLLALFLGHALSIWSREILGSNWSGRVGIQKEQELIQNGPYAYVRHPIYSGILLAAFGSALLRGYWIDLLAFALLAQALWRKSQAEEGMMQEAFGQTYREYMKKSGALIPSGNFWRDGR